MSNKYVRVLMSIIVIIISFLLGLLFLIGELFSGTIKLGVLSAIFNCLGTALTFYFFGMDSAVLAFISAALVSGGAIAYGARSKSWERFRHKAIVEGKHDDKDKERKLLLYPTQIGKTITTLRPSGRASFDGEIFEVRSIDGSFIDSKTSIQIAKISSSTIWVEQTRSNQLEQ